VALVYFSSPCGVLISVITRISETSWARKHRGDPNVKVSIDIGAEVMAHSHKNLSQHRWWDPANNCIVEDEAAKMDMRKQTTR
jgi:hypothetical protein